MNEMVERIAIKLISQALFKPVSHPSDDEVDWDNSVSELTKEKFRLKAREIISLMRVPTIAMQIAGERAGERHIGMNQAAVKWQAMIDEALK